VELLTLPILRESDFAEHPPTITGRTLTIRLATYNRIYEVGRVGKTIQRERILPGAFRAPLARPAGTGGYLRFRHDGERPGDRDTLDSVHGFCTALREVDGSIIGDYSVCEGAREDKLLQLISSGAIRGASMTALISDFKPSRDAAGPVRDITRVTSIEGASITPKPAYDDAAVLALREADPETAARRAERVAQERAWWATVPLARRVDPAPARSGSPARFRNQMRTVIGAP